jgi:hypothetical protein
MACESIMVKVKTSMPEIITKAAMSTAPPALKKGDNTA